MSDRSGADRTYKERMQAGRPNVTFSMAQEVSDVITRLAEKLGLSRSAIVDLAIRELAHKHKMAKRLGNHPPPKK